VVFSHHCFTIFRQKSTVERTLVGTSVVHPQRCPALFTQTAFRFCAVLEFEVSPCRFGGFLLKLVGGLEHGFYDFPMEKLGMECHHPN
jgi:hypothetical protein